MNACRQCIDLGLARPRLGSWPVPPLHQSATQMNWDPPTAAVRNHRCRPGRWVPPPPEITDARSLRHCRAAGTLANDGSGGGRRRKHGGGVLEADCRLFPSAARCRCTGVRGRAQHHHTLLCSIEDKSKYWSTMFQDIILNMPTCSSKVPIQIMMSLGSEFLLWRIPLSDHKPSSLSMRNPNKNVLITSILKP
jgi:hypothetical protein